MNKRLFVILGVLLLCVFAAKGSAGNLQGDYGFQQERMLVTSDSVIVISSFDSQDHVTAYTHYGIRLWNAPFHAKILSWQIAGDFVFVFSKDRQGTSTYLTCINKYTGQMIWQKP